eukprot:3829840-Rhodomonas_salina.1
MSFPCSFSRARACPRALSPSRVLLLCSRRRRSSSHPPQLAPCDTPQPQHGRNKKEAARARRRGH